MPPVNRRPSAPAPRAAAPAARRPAPAAAGRAAPPRGSSGLRGEEGRRRMAEVADEQEARYEAQKSMRDQPFRFFCPVGESRQLIVVDDAPDFFRWEHNLRDGRGKWTIYTSCVQEYANCPVCAANQDKAPYYAMYLTVIDLTPYVNKDNIEVPWSKKLLVVKQAQQKKIMRMYEREGTLRGALLQMTRDTEKDAAIGNDIELIEWVPEEEMEGYVNSYVNAKREQVDVIGYEPYDYDEVFPEQTEEQLAAICGGHTNTYNDHARNAGVSRGRPAPRGASGDDWESGGSRPAARPAARGAAPAARPAARPASRPAPRAAAPEEGEYPEDDAAGQYAEGDAPPTRRPAAPAARPASRPAPRAAAPEEDAAEEDAPQRPAARPAPRAAAAPAAAPGSLASRRAALRGGRG